MNRIVIEPCFNELHMEKLHIKNMCDYFHPDIYIIAEGIFPTGPEDQMKSGAYETFAKNYTLNGEGKRSFDFKELETEVQKCREEYPNIKFHLIEMDYPKNQPTNETYYQLFTFFLNSSIVQIQPDDIILPSESDMFFTKEQADQCNKMILNLKPNEGFGSSYLNFFESPKVQKILRFGRKIAFKYGDGSFYKKIMEQFLWEHKYSKMLPIYDFRTFHYEWLKPEYYFNMRVEQVPRDWSDQFIKAKDLIRSKPDNLAHRLNTEIHQRWTFELSVVPLRKEQHPKHIWDHESFKYYYE